MALFGGGLLKKLLPVLVQFVLDVLDELNKGDGTTPPGAAAAPKKHSKASVKAACEKVAERQ